jgi:hypothetical protein
MKAPMKKALVKGAPMPDTDIPVTDIPVIEIDEQRRVVRRDGKQVNFDREFEWSLFAKLSDAAKRGQPCTVASLAAGMSALMFFSALAWLKEPLNLTVVQFVGRSVRFQLMDMLTLEEVTP